MKNKKSPLEYGKLACKAIMQKYEAEKLPPEGVLFYHQGVLLSGMQNVYYLTKDKKYFDYIRKYADSEKPVVATVSKNGNMLNVKLINYIKFIDNPIESSKIGLRTCERLCKSLDIEFSYIEKKDKFTAELFIPIFKIVEKQ